MRDLQRTTNADADWVGRALHDLCQPLTALECRLVLATMEVEQCGSEADSAAVLRAAVDEALTQSARTIAKVREMQEYFAH